MVVRVRFRGISEALADLDQELATAVERELRADALRAYADLKLANPVDTGDSRNSWNISTNRGVFRDTGTISIRQRAKSINTIGSIFFTNKADYIQFLNEGSSSQARTAFIETSILRYFDSIPEIEYTNEN